MELTQEEREALVKNRIRRAYSTLREARVIVEQRLWHAAANRLYYACFYMVSAALMHDGHKAATHAGVIRLLGMHYVETGRLPKELGRFYSQIFELRQSGDYDDWKFLTEEDILPLLPEVERFLETLLGFFDFDTAELKTGSY